MLDKEAIKHIQESANIPDVMDTAANLISKPGIMVPSDFKMIDLQQFMNHKSHYEVLYKTDNLEDFVRYGKAHKQDHTACFISTDEMSAEIVFDLGTKEFPGHQKHKARLAMRELAAYKALLGIVGKKLSQKEAAEFVEDWFDFLDITSDYGVTLTPKEAARSLREITIETAKLITSSIGDFSNTMSAMEKIEAKNVPSIPANIIFTCLPYLWMKERQFQLRVSILTTNNTPQIAFRIMGFEAEVEDIALEFKGTLIEKFGFSEDLDVYIGEI